MKSLLQTVLLGVCKQKEGEIWKSTLQLLSNLYDIERTGVPWLKGKATKRTEMRYK